MVENGKLDLSLEFLQVTEERPSHRLVPWDRVKQPLRSDGGRSHESRPWIPSV